MNLQLFLLVGGFGLLCYIVGIWLGRRETKKEKKKESQLFQLDGSKLRFDNKCPSCGGNYIEEVKSIAKYSGVDLSEYRCRCGWNFYVVKEWKPEEGIK